MAPDAHRDSTTPPRPHSAARPVSSAECLVTVVVANPSRLLIGTAVDDGAYGRHVVEKVRSSGVEEAGYACRPGTMVQFRRVSGELLGEPVRIARFTLLCTSAPGAASTALVAPESLRGPSGEPIPLPNIPSRMPPPVTGSDAPASSVSMPPPQPKTTPAPLPAVPPPAGAKRPQAPPVRSSVEVAPAVEAALLLALRRENSDLHVTLRKNGAPAGSVTWIDALLAVAGEKYGGDATPVAKMLQIYLHPLYLRAPHADLRKASEMVDHVVGFVARQRAGGDAAVRSFAGQVLEGRGGDEQDQTAQIVSGKGLRTLEESLGKLQDPKTPRAALESVYRELPSVFARGFQLLHRADTDSAKREIHDTIRKTLDQSRDTKFYQSMSRQQREIFDQSHSETLRRLDSVARQQGMQGRK